LATALCANALNPLGFRHGLSRFSDPTGSAFGILYFGSSLKVAFVEVILRDRGEAHIDQIPIPYTELEAYICADIDVVEELNLVDLTGDAGLRWGYLQMLWARRIRPYHGSGLKLFMSTQTALTGYSTLPASMKNEISHFTTAPEPRCGPRRLRC
jgi:hypothetical protein